MNLLNTSSDRPKNPLRLVLILLVLFEFLGVISLTRLLISSDLSYIIKEKPNLIVFLLITILFVACYIKKSIWAIWVAASVWPVITYFTYVREPLDMKGWFVLISCNLITWSYLASKSDDYLTFIKYHKSVKNGVGEITESE